MGNPSIQGGGHNQPLSDIQHYTKQDAPTNVKATTLKFTGTRNQIDVLLAVFTAMMGSIGVTQKLAQTAANAVKENAAKQTDKNKEILTLRYTTLSGANPSTTEINANNASNQNIQFQRQDLQQVIVTLQQTAKGQLSTAQVQVGYLQQNTSEASAVLKLMSTVLKMIANMNKPNQ